MPLLYDKKRNAKISNSHAYLSVFNKATPKRNPLILFAFAAWLELVFFISRIIGSFIYGEAFILLFVFFGAVGAVIFLYLYYSRSRHASQAPILFLMPYMLQTIGMLRYGFANNLMTNRVLAGAGGFWLLIFIYWIWAWKKYPHYLQSRSSHETARLYPEPDIPNPLKPFAMVSVLHIISAFTTFFDFADRDVFDIPFAVFGVISSILFLYMYSKRLPHAWAVFMILMVPYVFRWALSGYPSPFIAEFGISWYIGMGLLTINVFSYGFKLRSEYSYYLSRLYRT